MVEYFDSEELVIHLNSYGKAICDSVKVLPHADVLIEGSIDTIQTMDFYAAILLPELLISVKDNHIFHANGKLKISHRHLESDDARVERMRKLFQNKN